MLRLEGADQSQFIGERGSSQRCSGLPEVSGLPSAGALSVALKHMLSGAGCPNYGLTDATVDQRESVWVQDWVPVMRDQENRKTETPISLHMFLM